MAIGPELALAANEKVVKRAECDIDSHLQDPEWIKDAKRGSHPKVWWEIELKYALSPTEKEVLCNLYTEAGWNNVSIRCSDEDKGYCFVRLDNIEN
jgi:hypothetical protein